MQKIKSLWANVRENSKQSSSGASEGRKKSNLRSLSLWTHANSQQPRLIRAQMIFLKWGYHCLVYLVILTCLFLSVICSCIILSFAGGIYAPPVRVRRGSSSSFFFFAVGSSWAEELWVTNGSGLLLPGDGDFRDLFRSTSLSLRFSRSLLL